MTKDEAREILENGGNLCHHVWVISATYMACSEGCCDDTVDGTEQALRLIEYWSDGEWDKVKEV